MKKCKKKYKNHRQKLFLLPHFGKEIAYFLHIMSLVNILGCGFLNQTFSYEFEKSEKSSIRALSLS